MSPGKYIVFALDGERYGLPIEAVQQILDAAPITRLANAGRNVLGVFDLRGETLPVVNARAILGFAEGARECFIVVEACGTKVAIPVDAIDRIAEFSENQIEAVGDTGGESPRSFVGKSNNGITVLLSPDTFGEQAPVNMD